MNTNQLIAAYGKDPVNKYTMKDPSIAYIEDAGSCMDEVEVFLKIKNNTLVDFSFDGYMSIVTTACVAITGEILCDKNMSIEDILKLDESFIHKYISSDISPRRRQAAMLGILAIKNAVHAWKGEKYREDFTDIEVCEI